MSNGIAPPPPGGGKGKAGGVSVKLVAMLVIAGTILMLVGGILGHAMDEVTQEPEPDDEAYDPDMDGVPDKQAENYIEDQDAWEDRRTVDRLFENIGIYFYLVGIVILILGLLVGGILCNSLPDLVRLGMVVAVGLLVFNWVYTPLLF